MSKIPNVSKDYTDRNRTSPFAFTGNKFEFRAVGSTQNVAVPMSILNAAVTHSFKECTTRLKELLKKKKRDEAVMELIRQVVKETKNIRFSGNGYSDDWKVEAKKRGLPILNTTPDALEVFKDKKKIQFLVDTNVLSHEEIQSRYHIAIERYVKTLDIEHVSLIELAETYVLPAVEKQFTVLARAHASIPSKATAKLHEGRLNALDKVLAQLLTELNKFKTLVEKSQKIHDEEKRMWDIVETLQPLSFKLRAACDEAEKLVADDLWPLPKYREMLLANTLA